MLGETTAPKYQSTTNPLDQYLTVAASLNGADVVEVIKQALDTHGVYTFTELTAVPSVQKLAEGEFRGHWELLQIFSYGTYKDYLAKKQELPELTVNQTKKLQHLTIITLSEQGKCIPYNTLLQELGMNNLRELEDLIIEGIYSEIIQGKLDQRRALLEVDTTIGRDIRKEDIPTIVATLENWYDTCETVLTSLQTQVDRANVAKSQKNQRRETLEQEIMNLKKSIKIQSQEVDEAYGGGMNDSREALGVERTPKKTTKKSLGGRGGKLFK